MWRFTSMPYRAEPCSFVAQSEWISKTEQKIRQYILNQADWILWCRSGAPAISLSPFSAQVSTNLLQPQPAQPWSNWTFQFEWKQIENNLKEKWFQSRNAIYSAPSSTSAGNTASDADNSVKIAHPIHTKAKRTEKSREKWIVWTAVRSTSSSSNLIVFACVCVWHYITHAYNIASRISNINHSHSHSFQQKFPWLLVAIDKTHDTKIPN